MHELRLLSVTANLGYGFPEASLEAGMARNPHVIGVDGGSIDPGPYFLGSGKGFTSPRAVKRDLRLMLRAAIPRGIPVIISSAGGSGGEPHLQATVRIVREVAREEGLTFRLAMIHAEQDKAQLKQRVRDGKTRKLAKMLPELDDATIDRATRIVGMMGPEPFIKALDEGAQVIVAGRSTDPAPWAGVVTRAQFAPALGWYSGKMLECGATASLPKGHDSLFVTVRDDHVECEPLNPIRQCTPLSVANHSLHENPSPCFHKEPGGTLDTSNCRFTAVSDRAVQISGMVWRPDDVYTIKLEGVERVGFRAITICGTRDPLLISQIESFMASVREAIAKKATDFGVPEDRYHLIFRIYGQNGVMGPWETVTEIRSHELGILVEVVSQTQEMANAVLSIARTQVLHVDFPGRLCKEGNMAFPFSPSDFEGGEVFRSSICHLVEPRDPYEMFPIEHETV